MNCCRHMMRENLAIEYNSCLSFEANIKCLVKYPKALGTLTGC